MCCCRFYINGLFACLLNFLPPFLPSLLSSLLTLCFLLVYFLTGLLPDLKIYPTTVARRYLSVPQLPWDLVKKVKASHTRYRALGPELIPVYRQSARRWLSHPPGSRLPLFSPGLQLPSHPQIIATPWPVPSYTARWQRHIGVNDLPKVVMQLLHQVGFEPTKVIPIAPPGLDPYAIPRVVAVFCRKFCDSEISYTFVCCIESYAAVSKVTR